MLSGIANMWICTGVEVSSVEFDNTLTGVYQEDGWPVKNGGVSRGGCVKNGTFHSSEKSIIYLSLFVS